jgi:hypothetical protein
MVQTALCGATNIGEGAMAFDPEEMVELYRQGTMTLQTAVERVITQKLQGLNATLTVGLSQ